MTKIKSQKAKQMYKQSEVDELFALAKTEEGVIILVGKFRVSRKAFKTFEEADEYIKARPYEILINVTALMVKLNQEDEKQKQNEKN